MLAKTDWNPVAPTKGSVALAPDGPQSVAPLAPPRQKGPSHELARNDAPEC